MITLDVKDYCHNCPNFEADVDSEKIYCSDGSVIVQTFVRCYKRHTCEQLFKYIEKERKTSSQNDA